jgi:hypothetical protein
VDASTISDDRNRLSKLRVEIHDIEEQRDALEEAGEKSSRGLLERQWRLEDEVGRTLVKLDRAGCGDCGSKELEADADETLCRDCGGYSTYSELRDLEGDDV